VTAYPASLHGSFARLRLTVAALTFLAAAPLLLAWTLTTLDQPTTAVVWGGLALAVLTFGLLCLVGAAVHHDLGLSRWKIGSLMLVWSDLRFYTYRTAIQLLEQNGYELVNAMVTGSLPLWKARLVSRSIAGRMDEWAVRQRPNLLGYQCLLLARPSCL